MSKSGLGSTAMVFGPAAARVVCARAAMADCCRKVLRCIHVLSRGRPGGLRYLALRRLANMRYAPGTPAGNCRNHEYAVKIYTPFPYRVQISPPGRGSSPGSCDEMTV